MREPVLFLFWWTILVFALRLGVGTRPALSRKPFVTISFNQWLIYVEEWHDAVVSRPLKRSVRRLHSPVYQFSKKQKFAGIVVFKTWLLIIERSFDVNQTRTRALVIKATDSNATLVEQHEAFGEIVRLYQDMAYACAYAVLGDFHLAEDVSQEAFITAWHKLAQLRHPEAFPGWFRRIVLTACNRRTRGKRLAVVPLDASVDVSSLDVCPQAVIEQLELKKMVLAAIKSLPQNERMPTAFFYINGHSHKEISEFLEVPVTTVAKRLYSARNRLKDMMMEAFKDDFDEHRPSRTETFADKVKRGIYDAYTGQYRYELRPDLVVTIRREGNKLMSEAAGQRNELLDQGESESGLRTKEYDGRGEFVRDEQGQVTHFIYYEFGREIGLAKKVC